MKHVYILFVIILVASCQTKKDSSDTSRPQPGDTGVLTADSRKASVETDLPQILKRDTLKAIMIYSSTSYFLYRGQPMGYEYELVERLADYMGVKLKIVVATNMNNMFEMLRTGEGDLIAYGMTVTRERQKNFLFTRHHATTHQSLIQRKPDNWRKMKLHEIKKYLVNDPLELIGKTVHVRENSSYYYRLQNLMDEIGGEINIKTVSGEVSTEELIRQVAEKKIDFTIADYNIASINKTYYPILDISVPVSFSQRIAWAVRPTSPQLHQKINQWIQLMRKETDYYVIYNKYFKNKKAYSRRIRSDLYSLESGRISMYDPIVKAQADAIGWDWRLLSSMIYQESRFDPNVKSWAGAIGLMQLMPATAKAMGFKNLRDPKTNVTAGSRYLQKLSNQWQEIPDSSERIKFVLASYNVGANHVADARRLAQKYGKNPNRWDGHVAEFLLKLDKKKFYSDESVKYGYCRGDEPYKYVYDILERYEHYRKFIPDDKN
jgi:membrane-bound lytic murein transglycosylase F